MLGHIVHVEKDSTLAGWLDIKKTPTLAETVDSEEALHWLAG
jgi:hypothetical protein